ncbi:DUF7003 family protein [Chitinophaga alhagiae]|uniref:DUF7003 family protein n=1 Tax=Chitinophaga alhagiae TaxID=2203219 RepID=UPI000E5B5695|nr:hypothetical protein [Chitinophaga alhagiae]
MPFTEQDILAQLDEAAANYTFPMLDNGYLFHGDQQLTLFRDGRRWAMLIEIIAWNNRLPDLGGLFTIAYTYGNCINGAAMDNDHFFSFAADNGTPAFPAGTGGYLSPAAHSIRVRNSVIPLRRDAEHYAARGIRTEADGRIHYAAFMRGLLPEYARLFWVTRADIAQKLPADLPEILTMAAWRHPDLAGEELPGQTDTFRQLARVLATGEVAAYRPATLPNTHWANWPEGGKL